MNSNPTVSIIIPLYNQQRHIAACIDSVLAQTVGDWELIVVDDGSTDDSAEIVRSYGDARIILVHQQNAGLPAARNTGLRNARAELISFLDSDDLYEPDKLANHLRHLESAPDVALSYGSRLDIDDDGQPLKIARAPQTVGLRELVTGYPFTINDIMIRRSEIERVGQFDESYRRNSEDRNWYLRLAMADCQMARVDRIVAQRRLHADRSFSAIPFKIETYFRALHTALLDPDCPEPIVALREQLYTDHFVEWGIQAALQGESELAAEYLAEADMRWSANGAKRLRRYISHVSTRTPGDHIARTDAILAALPDRLAALRNDRQQIIGRNWLLSGFRDGMWGRDSAEHAFEQAHQLCAIIDTNLVNRLTDQLVNYAACYGLQAMRQSWLHLQPGLSRQRCRVPLRTIYSDVLLNHARQQMQDGQPRTARVGMLHAIASNPRVLTRRDVLKSCLQSLSLF